MGCKRSWQSPELGSYPSNIKVRTNVSHLKQFVAFLAETLCRSPNLVMVWLGFFSIRKAPCVYKLVFAKLFGLKKSCSVISCIIKKNFFCEQQSLVSCGLVPHGGIMLHLMRSTLAETFSPVHKDTVSCEFSGVYNPFGIKLPLFRFSPIRQCNTAHVASCSSLETWKSYAALPWCLFSQKWLKIKAFENSIPQFNLTETGQQAKR